MKKVEKVVVIHLGEGINESYRPLLWKWFGQDVQIKPVHYAALSDEFDFKKHADLVICRESVNGHAKLIQSQWPYPVHILCIGKPKSTETNIEYVPSLEEWDNREYKKQLSQS